MAERTWSEDTLARRQNGLGLLCDRCDKPARPGNPLYPQPRRKYRHLYCDGKMPANNLTN